MSYIANTAFEARITNGRFDDLINIAGRYQASSADADCSAGLLCVRNGQLPAEGFDDPDGTRVYNENSWYMNAAADSVTADDVIYACNTYDWQLLSDGRGNNYSVGRQTLGLGIPAGRNGTFTEGTTNAFTYYDVVAKKVSTFQTLEELKADIRKNLQENAERVAENEHRTKVIEMATNNITVDIPSVMIDNRVNTMVQEMAMRIEQQGLNMEQYLQYAGTDIAKIREEYRETAEKNVKTDLMLEEVAKAENITVEAADIHAEVAAMAAAYGATPKQVRKIITEQGRLTDLTYTVLHKKTIQFIIDHIAG